MRPGRIEQFSHLSPFASLEEFNEHINRFSKIHRKEFTKGEWLGFERLVRFSAKYHGVANAKITKVVAACTEQGGISRSTFERMLRKAKKLNIIAVHHTVRKKGGYAHNVFVFQRFDGAQGEKLTERKRVQKPHQISHQEEKNQEETLHSSKAITSKKINNRIEEELDYTYTSDHVPVEFRNLVKCFFDSADIIESYYSRARLAAYKTAYESEPSILLEVATASFKQLIGKMKKGKVRDPYAYYYSICLKKFEEHYLSEISPIFENIPEDHWLLM